MSFGAFATVPTVADNVTPISVLVTGASRGIGLELVKQYARANRANKVFAAVRNVQAIDVLHRDFPNIIAVPLDVSDEQSVRASVQHVTAVTDHLDVLINNAGIVDFSGIKEATRAVTIEQYTVNAAGTLSVTQSYIALLEAGSALHPETPSTVVNVSTNAASNALAKDLVKKFGKTLISYGMSKAALNYLTSAAAATYPTVIFLSVHPGMVDTDMTKGMNALVSAIDSAKGLRRIVATKKIANSGEFIDNITGEIIPL